MNTIQLTPQQLHILRHSLGLDDSGNGRQYRNHYCIGPGCDTWDDCQELVSIGLMKDHGKQAMWGDLHGLTVTPEGMQVEKELRPPPKKLTRSQKRYREYLHNDGLMSFGDWLKRTHALSRQS